MEQGILEQMCEVGRRLHGRNLLAAGDGNISIRMGDGRIAMTPAGAAKAWLTPSDMSFLHGDGTVLSGNPSSERLMHLAVYQVCPEAQCVIHAHPPTAIAWTVARPELHELPADAIPEVILAAGRIPVVPYARPGTLALGEGVRPYLPQHRLLLLSRHGALCWGESLEEAYKGMERLEHVAQILKAAVELGGIASLPETEVLALRAVRERIGPRIL